MRSILAIDPSVKSTGWAFGLPDGDFRTGVVALNEHGSSNVRVWRSGMIWLTKAIAELQPDIVAIEKPFFRSGHSHATDVTLEGLNAHLQTTALIRTGTEPIMVARNSALKALTGKGRVDEGEGKEVVHAACVALGWATEADPFDVSDALAVWAAAAMQIDPAFAASFTPLMRASA